MIASDLFKWPFPVQSSRLSRKQMDDGILEKD